MTDDSGHRTRAAYSTRKPKRLDAFEASRRDVVPSPRHAGPGVEGVAGVVRAQRSCAHYCLPAPGCCAGVHTSVASRHLPPCQTQNSVTYWEPSGGPPPQRSSVCTW